MVQNAPPSGNQAGADTLAGMLRLVMTKFLQNVDDMLPAKVVAYDRTTNRATVQPLIAFVTTANEIVQRATVASVPVLQLGGGGFVLSFPILPGDLGWIKANDRDISLFKKTLANSSPNTQRKHTFEDALFIPDTMFKSVVIDEDDANSVVLQNLAGTVRLAISETALTITSPLVKIDTASCVIGGIDYITHKHTGVVPGGGTSGGPTS